LKRQTYGFRIVRLKSGRRDGDVTERRAVVRTGGLEDGLKDGRPDTQRE
jgi:hypothetical protein